MTVVATPKPEARTVIMPKANMDATNTTTRLFFMANIAAIKNVLSPNSETIMTDREATKACKKPPE